MRTISVRQYQGCPDWANVVVALGGDAVTVRVGWATDHEVEWVRVIDEHGGGERPADPALALHACQAVAGALLPRLKYSRVAAFAPGHTATPARTHGGRP